MALASELDLEALLQRIADLAREVIGARYAAVGVIGEHGELTRFVHSGIDAETAERIGELPKGRGVLGVLVEEDRPLRLREISEHPRSYGFPEHHPLMHTFLGVPISVRGAVFGRLYLTEKQGGACFTKDDERIAMTLAAQAGIAIENARLTEALRDLAVLEERERISKELHDGVIQSIYSVGMALQAAGSMIEEDPALVRQRIDDAIRELDGVVRDVRSYIFDLRPSLVEERSIDEAIARLTRELEVNTLAGTKIDLDRDALGRLDGHQQFHVVQIVREILSNVARHSRASNVRVSSALRDGTVVIEVEDDGIGFDRDTVRRGHGLRNIDQRVRALEGSIDIVTRDPRGTKHVLRVPLPGGSP